MALNRHYKQPREPNEFISFTHQRAKAVDK